MENFENNNENLAADEVSAVNKANDLPLTENVSEPICQETAVEVSITDDSENGDYTPVPYNPVIVEKIVPEKDGKKSTLGLKVFAVFMAVIIIASVACFTGYYIGSSKNGFKPKVNVNLASKPADTDEMTAAQVYDRVSDSVVGIIVYNDLGAAGAASGVIYTEDGYIVTNDHIYSSIPAAKFKVYTQDGREYNATYVAGDVISDLAVLKIDADGFKAATFGNSDEIIYGENVVAIGRPDEPTKKASITRGIVSATDCRVNITSNYSARFIQTDSPINPGSSGGALVNMYGQVIGITSAKLITNAHESVGYAIPTTTMKFIVEELIKEGKVVSRAKLGITYNTVTNIVAELGGYKYVGLLVREVSEDCDLYGKLKAGDTIVRINDIDVVDDSIVLDIIEQCRAGDTISVTFINKDGETKTLDAVLRANVGESSYQTELNINSSYTDGNKDFYFPEGE